MQSDTDARRRSLYAAMGFCQLADSPEFPEIAAFKAWLSTWSGIGHVVVGMERQGFAMSQRKLVDDGWAAGFQEHALLAPAGRTNAPTPFEAVQRAVWQALNHRPMGSPGVAETVEQDIVVSHEGRDAAKTEAGGVVGQDAHRLWTPGQLDQGH